MADKEFEPDDPFQPMAVALSTPGYDGMDAMARCFVEEYAMLGWPPERIFRLFTVPEFAGSYSVMQERGPDYVRKIIVSVFGQEFEASDLNDGPLLIPVLQRTKQEGEGDAPGL